MYIDIHRYTYPYVPLCTYYTCFIYIIYKANSLESQLKFKLNNKKNIVERENELFTTTKRTKEEHTLLNHESTIHIYIYKYHCNVSII